MYHFRTLPAPRDRVMTGANSFYALPHSRESAIYNTRPYDYGTL